MLLIILITWTFIRSRSYYDEDGSRYNLGRVPIGGSDFSTGPYTLDDTEYDNDLKYFHLTKYDMKDKIPMIKRAQELSPTLKLTSAVWSPPIWMKTNHRYSGPSKIKSFDLLKERSLLLSSISKNYLNNAIVRLLQVFFLNNIINCTPIII